MAARTLCWKNVPVGCFLPRHNNISNFMNIGAYLPKFKVNHRNVCLSNHLNYTGNAFYSPILKFVHPDSGFYQPVVRSYAKSRDKKKSDKGIRQVKNPFSSLWGEMRGWGVPGIAPKTITPTRDYSNKSVGVVPFKVMLVGVMPKFIKHVGVTPKLSQKKKVNISEDIVSEVINSETMKSQMQDVIEKLKEDYIKNLSLRSTTGSIETIPITYEGKEYILQDLAQVVRKNPKTVVINMAAFPQVIPTVLQAINQSGMNLNPQQDGTTLFIPIPKVTKEHRESLAKNAKALFVKCRDNIKDVQNKYIKVVKTKEKDGLARDTSLQISEYISFVASEYISSAEKLMEMKHQELLKDTQQ